MKEISDRQTEIVEAAGRILSASGVSGLTVKNLAREMKFTEGAIYRHFESKEEVIIALLNYLAKQVDERLEKAVAVDLPPDEKLATLLNGQFKFFKKNPHFVVAVFSDGLMEESQKVNKHILKIMALKQKHLLQVIREGQEQGIFSQAIDAEDLVHIVMGSFRLQMYKWRAGGFDSDLKKKGEKLVENILKIIKKQS